MFRALSVAVATLALLGTGALPASAATASHPEPKVHNFAIPGGTGIKAWGNYSSSGGSVHVTVCVRETSPNVILTVATGIAFSKNLSRHQQVAADILGHGKQVCRSMTTKDTAHLFVSAVSVTADGHSHIGKMRKLY